MSEQIASRTLLKSPPELWAECSDARSLARHLDTFFGDIRITRLEPETTVAWEGERGSGTVRLEPAGWGTRVTLTARRGTNEPPAPPRQPVAKSGEQPPAPVAFPHPAPVAFARPAPVAFARDSRPATFLARLLRRFGPEAHHAAPSVEVGPPQPAPDETEETAGVLDSALESLGTAHHRPFSRA